MALLQIALRELRYILRNKRFLLIAISGPIIYGLLFSAAYWNKHLVKVPITIVDRDNSALSRNITTALLASPTFKLCGYSDSADVFPEQAARGISHGCFVIPYHFERDVKAGRETKIAAWVDASNTLTGNVVINSASTIFGTYSAGIDIQKSLLRGQAPSSLTKNLVLPIQDEYRFLYNPGFNDNYTNFLLLGLVIIAVQLMTLLLVVRSGSREVEDRTLDDLRKITKSPITVLVGKAIPYILIMILPCFIGVNIPFWLVKVPMIGNEWLVLLATVWLVALLVFGGIGVSSLMKDSVFTTESFTVFAMPAFLLSGYTWPTFGMPKALQYVSMCLPLNYYGIMLRKISMMGDSLQYMNLQILGFEIWTCVSLILGYFGVWHLLRARIKPQQIEKEIAK